MIVPRTWAERRLPEALASPFAAPVTADLGDVLMSNWCAVGGMHHDARPAKRERFPDGQRIRKSDIHSVSRDGRFWVIQTASQSGYVVVPLHADGGQRSAVDFLKMLCNGFYSTPGRLH